MRRAAIAIVTVGALSLLAYVALLYWIDRPLARISLPLDSELPPTEELAISLSLEALSQATGQPKEDFSPVPYWDSGPELFAHDPGTAYGYLLWHDRTSPRQSLLFHYYVRLEWEPGQVIATIKVPH